MNNEEIKNQEKTAEEMKNEKKEKAKEALRNFWSKTTDISKKAASGIQKGAKIMAEQTKENVYKQQLKKYNPITENEFKSKKFNIPNVIQIVDDAVRRGIEVCEDAIGWLEIHKDVEVLHLYDEYINDGKCNIQFIPFPKCDAVYLVDVFDKTKFINAETAFEKCTNEKLTELENVALLLGAKKCSIEIQEANIQSNSAQIKASATKNKNKIESSASATSQNNQSGKNILTFEGHDNPVRPDLKWFANDDNINNLIETRCKNKGAIKSKILILSGSTSATMSKKTACAIDKILNINASLSLEKKAIKEHSSTLIFEIEF